MANCLITGEVGIEMKNMFSEFDINLWLSDEKLGRCLPGTRGIWFDALCAMHKSAAATLSGSPETLSRILRCTVSDLQSAIGDLKLTDAAEVRETSAGEIMLINRKMQRELREREQERKKKAVQREKQASRELVPVVSPQCPLNVPPIKKGGKVQENEGVTETGSKMSPSCPENVPARKRSRGMCLQLALPVQPVNTEEKPGSTEVPGTDKQEQVNQDSLVLTPVQLVVERFKTLKGFDEVPGWDREFFAAHVRAAGSLLRLTVNGDGKQHAETAIEALNAIARHLTDVGLSWTLATVVRWYPDWKMGNIKPDSRTPSGRRANNMAVVEHFRRKAEADNDRTG